MKKQLLAFVAGLGLVTGLNAQNYYSLPSTGTLAPYSSLATATVVVAQGSNDVLSAAQTLPFTWNFYGKPVTSYKVSDNGYITFDAAATTSVSVNTTLPNANAPKNAIFVTPC